MNIKRVTLTTDGAGAYAGDVRVTGEIMSIGLLIGDLSTPDLAVTDKATGKSILAKAGIAADAHYHPRVLSQDAVGVDIAAAAGPPVINNVYTPVTVFGEIHVTLTGAGATKTGTLLIATRG